MDGRKDEQPPMECSDAGAGDYCVNDGFCPVGTCSEGVAYDSAFGVRVQEPTSNNPERVSVHHVIFNDLMKAGIWSTDAVQSMFYSNEFNQSGCHLVDTNCSSAWNSAYTTASAIGCPGAPPGVCTGTNNLRVCVGGSRDGLACCLDDICSPPDEFEQMPNRRANGFAILVSNNSTSVVIKENTSTLMAKYAFGAFRMNTINDLPREVRFFDNTSNGDGGGFTSVGCSSSDPCTQGPTDVQWVGNSVLSAGLTGGTQAIVSFSCSGKGHDFLWKNNTVDDAGGTAFAIRCWKDIKLIDNTSDDSCKLGFTGQNEVRIWPGTGFRTSNVDVIDHTITTSTNCTNAIWFTDADGVRVSGGKWNGLNQPAVFLEDVTDVYFDEAVFQGPGSGTGVDADDDGGTTTGHVQTSMNDTDCGSGGCINNFTTRVDNTGASGFIICTGTGVPDAACE
jgi:hypothetical protein